MAIKTSIPLTPAPPPVRPFDSDPRYIWLTPRQITDIFGLSKSDLYNWRDSLDGPPFAPGGGRKILYRLDLFQEWLERRLVTGFHDPKYKALLKQRREAKKKKQQRRDNPGLKDGENVLTHGIQVFRDPISPSCSTQPSKFRFLPGTGWAPKRPTLAEAAMAWFPFRLKE